MTSIVESTQNTSDMSVMQGSHVLEAHSFTKGCYTSTERYDYPVLRKT